MTKTLLQPANPPASGEGRAVIWVGVALGTFVTVLTMLDGARLRIGGMPVFIGWIIGTLIIWGVIAAISAGITELLRRHHKTIRRYAARQSGRAARGGWALTSRHSSRIGAAIARWAARQRSELATRLRDRGGTPSGTAGGPAGTVPAPAAPAAPPPRTQTGPAPQAPGGSSSQPTGGTNPAANGGNGMNQPAPGRMPPGRRAQRVGAGLAGIPVPVAWMNVVTQVADHEAEDDAAILAFISEQAVGQAAYAEALVEWYATHVDGKGYDPRSLAAVHDVADAAAHLAEQANQARRAFAEWYELPREYAANDGLLPYDGRAITGDGD